MNFEVTFDEEALDFLGKLEKPLKERIYNKIIAASNDPFHFFIRLTQRPDYKLRIGDYRVIAEIDTTNKRIEITLIGHRKNVYEK